MPQDVEDAAWTLYLRCDGGEGKACTELGKLHASSEWRAKDDKRAAELYLKGCSAGDAGGCENLAEAYTHGHGVARDRERSRELYQQACAGHRGFSCGILGGFYAVGYGVPRDQKRAREYLQHACEEGESPSCELNSTIVACDGGDKDACVRIEELKARYDAQDAPPPSHVSDAGAGPAAAPGPTAPSSAPVMSSGTATKRSATRP